MNKFSVTALLVLLSISAINASHSQEIGSKQPKETFNSLIDQTVKEVLSLREINQGWNQRSNGKYFNLSVTTYKENEIYLKKVEGIIPASFEKSVKYYFEAFDNTQFARNNQCGEQRLIEKLSDDTVITFFKGDGNIMASSREHLAVQNKKQLSENEILITRATIENYEGIIVDESAIRMNGRIYGIFLQKIDDNSTRLEGYFLFEIGGYVPNFMVNMMAESHIEVLENDIPYIQKL